MYMWWGGGGGAQPTGPYVYTFNHVTKKSPNFCRKDEENHPLPTPNLFVRRGGTTTPPPALLLTIHCEGVV